MDRRKMVPLPSGTREMRKGYPQTLRSCAEAQSATIHTFHMSKITMSQAVQSYSYGMRTVLVG